MLLHIILQGIQEEVVTWLIDLFYLFVYSFPLCPHFKTWHDFTWLGNPAWQ